VYFVDYICFHRHPRGSMGYMAFVVPMDTHGRMFAVGLHGSPQILILHMGIHGTRT
jgi:hypothetical protein